MKITERIKNLNRITVSRDNGRVLLVTTKKTKNGLGRYIVGKPLTASDNRISVFWNSLRLAFRYGAV